MQCKNIRKAAERTTCMLKRDRHLLKKIYELTVVYTFFSTKNVCEDREPLGQTTRPNLYLVCVEEPGRQKVPSTLNQ